MIDVNQIKDPIDCRQLIERDLGKPKQRGNSYNTYQCPLHNETKGYSLVVYDDHWQCFGKCGRGGDAIAWLQAYHNLSFQEACERLSSGQLPQMKPPKSAPRVKQQPVSEAPDSDWQTAAKKVAAIAMDTLWGKEGQRAWRYLQEERGLTEATIVDAGLGYIPGDYREWQTIEGLRVPCGITIPWYADKQMWGIKVRRATGQQRYQQVSGGSIKGGLYLADNIQPGQPILVCEGEFDALIAQQAGHGLLSAVAIGSAANKHIHPRWLGKFMTAPSLFVRMDADDAGDKAASSIAGLSQAVTAVQVPQGKDVNEFYLLAGHEAVRQWLEGLVG